MEFALGLAMLLVAINTTPATSEPTASISAPVVEIETFTIEVASAGTIPSLPYFQDELLSRNVELARDYAPNPVARITPVSLASNQALEPPAPTSKQIKANNIQLAMQAPTSDVYIVDLPPKVIQEAQQLAALPVKQESARLVVTPRAIQWELRVEDGRLDKAIRRWAKEAGYTFRWDADRYVLIAAGTTFSGTFENAIEQVLETPGIKNSEYPLEACVYNNEPPLLRITRLGDQKEECR